jgi:uncharacterized protein
MPQFTDPYVNMTPDRKMTTAELVRALRANLAAEEDATALYESHADATDNALAKAVLHDIANEERVHVGEFQRLISILLADEDGYLADGAEEVNVMAQKVAGGLPGGEAPKSAPTVGDMKK